MWRKAIFCIGGVIALVLCIGAVRFLLQKPSNDRNWATDQAVLATADIEGKNITIHNIRNFTYRSVSDFTPGYYDKTFKLADLESVWYVVEPFSGHGLAHTFLSFGFAGGDYVAVSVEIRKEKGEAFSPLKGLLRNYELMYVIADERDVIQLRSNFRNDQVYLYPVKTTPERKKTLFLDMLSRANKLAAKPEFYNSLFNTCTTNIVKHVNSIRPGRVPFNIAILFPDYSDHLAYDLGLFDTKLPWNEVRAHFNINERARAYADDPEFSIRIRENTTTPPPAPLLN